MQTILGSVMREIGAPTLTSGLYGTSLGSGDRVTHTYTYTAAGGYTVTDTAQNAVSQVTSTTVSTVLEVEDPRSWLFVPGVRK